MSAEVLAYELLTAREQLKGLKTCASLLSSHFQAAMQEIDLMIEEVNARLEEPHVVSVHQTYIRWPA